MLSEGGQPFVEVEVDNKVDNGCVQLRERSKGSGTKGFEKVDMSMMGSETVLDGQYGYRGCPVSTFEGMVTTSDLFSEGEDVTSGTTFTPQQ